MDHLRLYWLDNFENREKICNNLGTFEGGSPRAKLDVALIELKRDRAKAEKLFQDYLRGQLRNYPNPFINEIIQVGIPLTDKLYILATPQSLKSEMHGIQYEREDNSDLVYAINKDLYLFSRKAVACKDDKYLKAFVSRIKADKRKV